MEATDRSEHPVGPRERGLGLNVLLLLLGVAFSAGVAVVAVAAASRSDHLLTGVLLAGLVSAGLLAAHAAGTARMLRTLESRLARAEHAHSVDLKVVERLNDSLELFSRTAAHDLRNPLSTIRMWSDLLAKEIDGGSDIARQAVGFIQAASDRGLRLVNDLLEFALAGAVPAMKECEMSEVVMDAVLASGLDDVEQRVDSGPVVADQLQLKQALVNLLANARKHAPDAKVWVDAERFPGGWSIAVNDDGPGVDPEIEGTLFEPFVRGDGRTSADSSGLGLSLVARFAASHDATVEYVRRPSGGSQFLIRIPDAAPSPRGE